MKIYSTDISFKICIFGKGGVGKTTLTHRFLTNEFKLDTMITLGANIFVHYLEIDGKRINLQIWDFGGEEQFRFLLPAYAKGSSGGIFMFDITRHATIEKLDMWFSIFNEGLDPEEKSIPILMVGGKLDLAEKRSVTKEDAKELQNTYNLFDYIECSAKTGDNVNFAFEALTRKMMERQGYFDNK